MGSRVDCVIVGQGIAGSCVAWELARRGWTVKVIGDPQDRGSSAVAAGLITPLTGLRLALSWRCRTLLPVAWRCYEAMQREWGRALIDRRESLRVFRSHEEREHWQKRRHNSATAEFLGAGLLPGQSFPSLKTLEFGGAVLKGGGRVNCRALLSAMRDALRKEGAWVEELVVPEEIKKSGNDWILAGFQSPRVVFCEGYRAAFNPLWSGLLFRNVRGDLLHVRGDSALDHHLVMRGLFSAYLGRGLFCLGGNYDWEDPRVSLDPSAAEELCRRFAAVHAADFEVLQHRAGVRPIVHGRVPVVGEHPQKPGLYIVNGMASKGTLWAPAMAKRLLQIFEGKAAPDPEIDLDARLRSHALQIAKE